MNYAFMRNTRRDENDFLSVKKKRRNCEIL